MSYQYWDVLNSALRKYPVLRDHMAHQGICYVSIFCRCGQVSSIYRILLHDSANL